MKDIINKNLPCELFNLENGESFSLSPAGKLYRIHRIIAVSNIAVCSYCNQDSSNPVFARFKLTKIVYPRALKRPLYLKRNELFSSSQSERC